MEKILLNYMRRKPPWVRIPVPLLASREALRAYSVMVTSHLAMVEFRVRFPIGALRDRSSKYFGYTMIIKNQSKSVQIRQLYLDYASLV